MSLRGSSAVRSRAAVLSFVLSASGCGGPSDAADPEAIAGNPSAGASGSGGTGAGGAPSEGGAAGEPAGATPSIEVPGATFDAGVAPQTSNPEALPTIDSVSSGGSVTNGGTTRIRIRLTESIELPRFVVAVEGADGFFVTTAAESTLPDHYDIEIRIPTELDVTSLTVRIAPTDEFGNVGEYRTVTFRIIPSGVGDVKVTLSFDQSTDLDLHVVEPDGFEISYMARISPSGGELDLDSNSACSMDGINNENVFWSEGTAPSGSYVVRVENFTDCVGERVHYTVTVTNDDAVTLFRGAFEPATAGEIHTVATFEH